MIFTEQQVIDYKRKVASGIGYQWTLKSKAFTAKELHELRRLYGGFGNSWRDQGFHHSKAYDDKIKE